MSLGRFLRPRVSRRAAVRPGDRR